MLGTKLILNQHIIYSGRATNAAAQAGSWLCLLLAPPMSLLRFFALLSINWPVLSVLEKS